MALGKTSKFGVAEGLIFENTSPNTHDVQQVQDVNTISTIGKSAVEATAPQIEFGATQGKKGHKAPRINMAFSPDVHAWIKTASRQQGISATEFVNNILRKEKERSEGK